MSRSCLFPLLLLATLSSELGAGDPKLRDSARQLRSKYRDVVVAVEIALDVGKEKENAQAETVTGTVLGPDGLTVTCLTDVFGIGIGEAVDIKIGEVKMVLGNGRKITAELVGRDDKHHLAFVLPTLSEKIKDHPYLKLSTKKTAVDLLDETLLLYRIGENNRLGVAVCRVTAEGDNKGNPTALDLGELGLGGPIFDVTGRPLGIVSAGSGSRMISADPVIRSGEIIEAALKKIRMK